MTNSAKTAIVVPCTAALMTGGFFLLRANVMPQILTTIFAIIWGVSSVVLFFYSINLIAQNFRANAYNKIFAERPTLNDVFLELTGKELRD